MLSVDIFPIKHVPCAYSYLMCFVCSLLMCCRLVLYHILIPDTVALPTKMLHSPLSCVFLFLCINVSFVSWVQQGNILRGSDENVVIWAQEKSWSHLPAQGSTLFPVNLISVWAIRQTCRQINAALDDALELTSRKSHIICIGCQVTAGIHLQFAAVIFKPLSLVLIRFYTSSLELNVIHHITSVPVMEWPIILLSWVRMSTKATKESTGRVYGALSSCLSFIFIHFCIVGKLAVWVAMVTSQMQGLTFSAYRFSEIACRLCLQADQGVTSFF